MKIGILGAGSVGGTLGRCWARRGHEVRFGVRNPRGARVRELLAEGHGMSAGLVPEAAAFSDVVVLAVPWEAVPLALRDAGDLHNRPLLDCTNPLLPDLSGLDVGHRTSGAERVAEWSGAQVVKVFNTTGFENMADPLYPGGEALTMFYCGDHAAAKARAARLAADLGFEPLDCGDLRQARLLEPLALLWIHLAIHQRLGREFAFRLVHRERRDH